MISYPDSLPRPSQDYSISIENSSLRSTMDSGRVRQRRRFTNSFNQINVKWTFTDEEYRLFEGFIFHGLDGGNSWFEVEVLSGNGISVHKARLQEGRYKASYLSHMNWRVTAVLDLDKVDRMTGDELAVAIYGEENIGLWADQLHEVVNIRMPEDLQ